MIGTQLRSCWFHMACITPQVTPDDPALWCALGDLHMKDEFYVEAWERSGHRNARAKRSLGRTYVRGCSCSIP